MHPAPSPSRRPRDIGAPSPGLLPTPPSQRLWAVLHATRIMKGDPMKPNGQLTALIETAQEQIIGPAVAKEWLERYSNPNNRRINRAVVENYRQLMEAGLWLVSIAFALCFD